MRQERSAPLIAELEAWMRQERRQALAPCRGRQGHGLHAQALGRLHPLPDDGRICLTNNAAERALRGIALGRKAWLFAGSDRGGERAAVIYSLIVTAKLNDVDPQAWLADVLARIAGHPAHQARRAAAVELDAISRSRSSSLIQPNYHPTAALAGGIRFKLRSLLRNRCQLWLPGSP